MNKKAVGSGAIILIAVLLILIGVFLVVLGIAIFGGNKEISGGGTGTETPEDGTGIGTGTGTPTQPKSDDSKKAPSEQEQNNYILNDYPGDKNNSNYGRCTPNWPSNAGAYQPGISETFKSQCTKHIEQGNCLGVDIYRVITDTFGEADGIPDCSWN